MKYLTNLKAKFKIQGELRSLRKQTKHPIEYSMTIGGINYYSYKDPLHGAAIRQMDAQAIFMEFEQKVDKRYLQSFSEAIKGIKGKYKEAINEAIKKQDFIGLMQLYNNQQREEEVLFKFLGQKQEHITHVDLLYKLASVKFFDASENPNKWNEVYAEQKILHWQKYEDMDAFFLRISFGSMLPSFDTSKADLRTYTKAQREQLLKTLELHQKAYSITADNKELISSLKSWAERLKKSMHLQS